MAVRQINALAVRPDLRSVVLENVVQNRTNKRAIKTHSAYCGYPKFSLYTNAIRYAN